LVLALNRQPSGIEVLLETAAIADKRAEKYSDPSWRRPTFGLQAVGSTASACKITRAPTSLIMSGAAMEFFLTFLDRSGHHQSQPAGSSPSGPQASILRRKTQPTI
jgi:hypothetical protein